MKVLRLFDHELSVKDVKVCVGELMNCLRNLKRLDLRFNNISLEMKTKLKICADQVGCEVHLVRI